MDSLKILFSIFSSFTTFIMDFLFFFLLRIYFDIEIIGEYGFLNSFFMTFSFLLALGLATTYLKIIFETENSNDEAICNGTFLFLRGVQFIIYLFVVLVSFPLFLSSENSNVFFLFLIGNLVGFVNFNIIEYFYVYQKRIFLKSLAIVISSLIKIILLLFLLGILKSDILLIGYIYLISKLSLFAIYVIILKDIKIKKPNMIYLKKFLHFAFPLILLNSIMTIVNNIDVLLIKEWFSIEEVANFFTAKQFIDFFLLIAVNISFILLAIFSKNVSLGENEENLTLVKQVHRFLNLVTVPLVFIIFIYSTRIIVFILGNDYGSTGIYVSILSIKLIILSIDLANFVYIRAIGEIKYYATIMTFYGLFGLFLLIFFISPLFLNLGALGGAFAIVISLFIKQMIIRPIIYKKYGLGFYWALFRNIGIMSLVFFVQIFIDTLLNYSLYYIPFFILLDLFLYFLINYFFKGFEKEDLRFFLRLINYRNIKESIYSEMKGNKSLNNNKKN